MMMGGRERRKSRTKNVSRWKDTMGKCGVEEGRKKEEGRRGRLRKRKGKR